MAAPGQEIEFLGTAMRSTMELDAGALAGVVRHPGWLGKH